MNFWQFLAANPILTLAALIIIGWVLVAIFEAIFSKPKVVHTVCDCDHTSPTVEQKKTH